MSASKSNISDSKHCNNSEFNLKRKFYSQEEIANYYSTKFAPNDLEMNEALGNSNDVMMTSDDEVKSIIWENPATNSYLKSISLVKKVRNKLQLTAKDAINTNSNKNKNNTFKKSESLDDLINTTHSISFTFDGLSQENILEAYIADITFNTEKYVMKSKKICQKFESVLTKQESFDENIPECTSLLEYRDFKVLNLSFTDSEDDTENLKLFNPNISDKELAHKPTNKVRVYSHLVIKNGIVTEIAEPYKPYLDDANASSDISEDYFTGFTGHISPKHDENHNIQIHDSLEINTNIIKDKIKDYDLLITSDYLNNYEVKSKISTKRPKIVRKRRMYSSKCFSRGMKNYKFGSIVDDLLSSQSQKELSEENLNTTTNTKAFLDLEDLDATEKALNETPGGEDGDIQTLRHEMLYTPSPNLNLSEVNSVFEAQKILLYKCDQLVVNETPCKNDSPIIIGLDQTLCNFNEAAKIEKRSLSPKTQNMYITERLNFTCQELENLDDTVKDLNNTPVSGDGDIQGLRHEVLFATFPNHQPSDVKSVFETQKILLDKCDQFEVKETSCENDWPLIIDLDQTLCNLDEMPKIEEPSLSPKPFHENNINLMDAFKNVEQFITAVTDEMRNLNEIFYSQSMRDCLTQTDPNLVTSVIVVKKQKLCRTNSDTIITKLIKPLDGFSKDEKLVFVHNIDNIPTPKPKEFVLCKIRNTFVNFEEQIKLEEDMKFEFYSSRQRRNFYLKEGRFALKSNTPLSMSRVSNSSKGSKKKFNLMVFLAKKIFNMLVMGQSTTKRQIFYQIKSILKSQFEVNSAADALSRFLDLPLWDLRIFATSKGLVYGDLTIHLGDEEIICNSKGGTLIPQDLKLIDKITTSARFLLIVEKDSIFQKLLDEDIPSKLGNSFILITGKGYPDMSTRYFTKKIWSILQIPAFILVDGDPHGIDIMLLYRYGCMTSAHLSDYITIPKLQWIGVHPSEIQILSIKSEPLTERDVKKAREILSRPYIDTNPRIRHEIEFLLETNCKAEIEGLIHGSNFLSIFYLPNKFSTKDFF